MPGFLTTHILDTANGTPASGVRIELHRIDGDNGVPIGEAFTNDDGRTDSPLLPEDRFEPGTYKLTFWVKDYLERTGGSPAFLDKVPIRFKMVEAEHYHVPLLLAPFGYTTYRGS